MLVIHLLFIHILLASNTVVTFICAFVDVAFIFRFLQEAADQTLMILLSRSDPGIVADV